MPIMNLNSPPMVFEFYKKSGYIIAKFKNYCIRLDKEQLRAISEFDIKGKDIIITGDNYESGGMVAEFFLKKNALIVNQLVLTV